MTSARLASALITLLAVRAGAEPLRIKAVEAPDPDQKSGPDALRRMPILIAVSSLDAALVAWTSYELFSGERSLTASGLTLVATAPSVAFGAAVLAKDPSDGLMWGATIVAAGFLVKAAVDVVQINARGRPRADAAPPTAWHWHPVILANEKAIVVGRSF